MDERIPPHVLAPSPASGAKVAFGGDDGEFRKLVTRGALLELVTFGFYRFWLATNIRRHLWTKTSIEGDSPEYTGTGRELLIGFLFALAILVPIYVAYFAIGIEAERWKAFASVPFGVVFYALYQFAIYRARRYRLTRTLWRGVRFWMTGSGLAYMVRALGWTLLTVLTLGLAYPWREAALERYKMSHTFYGDLPGQFDGRGWDFFKRGWWLWLIALGPIAVLGAIVAVSFAMAPARTHALPSTQLQFSPGGQVFGIPGDRRTQTPGEFTPPQWPLGKLNQEEPSTMRPLALDAVLGAGLLSTNVVGQGEIDRGSAPHRWAQLDSGAAGIAESSKIAPQLDAAPGPTDASAYTERGIVYKRNGDLDRAIADFDKAIELDSAYAPAYYNRGNVYYKKVDLDRAIADFDKAIEYDPKNAEAYTSRGLIYADRGDLDRAIADLDKAIELNSKYTVAYLNRGNVYSKKGDLDHAIADYSKAIELDPKYALAYKNRGDAYDTKGDHDRAIADLHEATRFDPKFTFAYNNRGNAYRKKGDLDRAIADLDKAIELNPKDALAYDNRGLAFQTKGDLDHAIADFGKVIELDPKLPMAYSNRGLAYAKRGDLDRAIADYDKAIELDPKFAFAYSSRGYAYDKKGDLDRAIADYDKAIELDPKLAAAYNDRSRLAHAYNSRGLDYASKGDFDRAIADLDKAIELDPKNAFGYSSRGYTYEKKGDLDRAIADYDKAIELAPKSARAYSSRGYAYERKGDLDRAIADYDKAIELNPKDAFANNHRGVAHIKKGDLFHALTRVPIPQPLRPFVLPLFFAALIAFPFVYAAFKATEWKWWVEGIQISGDRDNLRFASDLGLGAFITNVWKLVGMYALVTNAFASLAVGLVVFAKTALGIDVAVTVAGHKPLAVTLLIAIAIIYVAYVLAVGVVHRIYMVQRVWKIVVSSICIENLSAADHVTAKGEAAGAIGEGLADSLDVAGF